MDRPAIFITSKANRNGNIKRVSTDKSMNDPAYERTREYMAGFGRAGEAASIVRDLTAYTKDDDIQARLLTVLKRER
ncbi:hypothetical protein [Paraflavitalea speifideaquila]|uniref:hypothetical protein n=1 Tax=Paraflavitalea speifideaquila TaxID=3076558 RepID=UPI0028ED0271|nr:hypothetical protein [Paraflavitalea speifideiaquila]